jgi:hypothetical protein
VEDTALDIALLAHGIEMLSNQIPFGIAQEAYAQAHEATEDGHPRGTTDERITACAAVAMAVMLADRTLESLPEAERTQLLAEAKGKLPDGAANAILLEAGRNAQIHLFVEQHRQHLDEESFTADLGALFGGGR